MQDANRKRFRGSQVEFAQLRQSRGDDVVSEPDSETRVIDQAAIRSKPHYLAVKSSEIRFSHRTKPPQLAAAKIEDATCAVGLACHENCPCILVPGVRIEVSRVHGCPSFRLKTSVASIYPTEVRPSSPACRDGIVKPQEFRIQAVAGEFDFARTLSAERVSQFFLTRPMDELDGIQVTDRCIQRILRQFLHILRPRDEDQSAGPFRDPALEQRSRAVVVGFAAVKRLPIGIKRHDRVVPGQLILGGRESIEKLVNVLFRAWSSGLQYGVGHRRTGRTR